MAHVLGKLLLCLLKLAWHEQLILPILLAFSVTLFLVLDLRVLFISTLIVVFEDEKFELGVQIARQLDLSREDVHLDLIEDFPGCFAHDNKFVFEAHLDHCSRGLSFQT